MNHVKLSNSKSGSAGMPCGGTCCKIVDIKSGEILGPNQTGELCVKSDTIMEGYQVQNSSDRIGSSGWFKTGDLAYYDEYHCFYIIDRVTELINVGEKSIHPCKLESILMEHPVVDRAVVLGLPDSNNEVVPVGFILPKSTTEPEIDLNELLEYVNKQVDEDENLKGGVRIVNNLPLTVTGKVRRKFFKESMISEEKTEVEEPPTD
ncbi:hypothetical protein WA026_012093 [Henosepilachna vigintioctopunctata]|uniref:Luciferin 4-monooxygenase n=1 Tax=Henosepilachna vigintioctopunctata TaxID=420089 RepID=A0AAW1VAV8_9CUCU